MSIITDVLTAGANNHQTTSEAANFYATDFISPGVVGAITNTSGVAPATGAWAVNANGTPAMNVIIQPGVAYVTATPTGQNSQTLRVRNTASITQTISANASGSTKYDWIYVKVDPTNANVPNTAGDNAGSVLVSRSTNSVTDDGAPPAYGTLIAKVTVANGAVSITNGNIADSRVRTGPNWFGGGTVLASSLSNPYKFRASLSGVQNITGATWTRIAFDTELFDTGSNFDSISTKGRFTAPAAGFYYFSGSVQSAQGSGNNIFRAALYKNGTAITQGGYYTTNNPTSSVSDLISLATNDYVELFAYNGAAGTISINATTETWFSGYLVSTT